MFFTSFLHRGESYVRLFKASRRTTPYYSDFHGLSQEEVAEKTGKLGFSKGRISNIEHGQSNITLSTLETLMKALDIAPEELFNFQRLSGVTDIEEKNLVLDIHRSVLRERNLDEVKYVVRITKDFLDTIDSQSKKNSSNSQ